MSAIERMKAVLPYVALVVMLIGASNFFWFFTESAALGGDALNGSQRDGQYFVGAHGAYSEVDRAT